MMTTTDPPFPILPLIAKTTGDARVDWRQDSLALLPKPGYFPSRFLYRELGLSSPRVFPQDSLASLNSLSPCWFFSSRDKSAKTSLHRSFPPLRSFLHWGFYIGRGGFSTDCNVMSRLHSPTSLHRFSPAGFPLPVTGFARRFGFSPVGASAFPKVA